MALNSLVVPLPFRIAPTPPLPRCSTQISNVNGLLVHPVIFEFNIIFFNVKNWNQRSFKRKTMWKQPSKLQHEIFKEKNRKIKKNSENLNEYQKYFENFQKNRKI